jgi:DNA-binding transcriptional regulator YiaG
MKRQKGATQTSLGNGSQHLSMEGFSMTTELEAELAKQTAQAKMLREARETLGVTNEELALLLGVPERTLKSWLTPGAANFRPMGDTAKMLLEVRLEQGTRKVAKILEDLRRQS